MDLPELQRNWDAFGRSDPLWAILTNPRLRGNKWDPAEFFSTGREDVAAVMNDAARLGVPRERSRALDFGCGVGRLTQALADYVEQAVGVDIAPSMIELARRYNVHGSRCEYVVNDTDNLSRFADGTFDIVYTGRVLQHVAPQYVERYIREFVRVLAPGGYLSFDVPSEHGLFAPDGAAQPPAATAYRCSIDIVDAPARFSPGERRQVLLDVEHVGAEAWTGMPLNLGNHWAAGDRVIVQDDARMPIEQPWLPGERRRLALTVTAPSEPGNYRLQFDLVHEGVCWFADVGSAIAQIDTTVGESSERSSAVSVAEALDSLPIEPQMEMHAVPRKRVEELLVASGARLLEVRRVLHCGPTWLAFRYDCSR
jgi:SAM-dependent methyltransferase